MRVIVLLTSAETIPEVLVIRVALRRLFGMHVAFGAGFLADAQSAGCSRGITSRTTVANEIPFVKQFDESVFAMTGYRARVADSCGIVRLITCGRRRITGQAGEERLSQGSELTRASVELLVMLGLFWPICKGRMHTYGSASRASASSCS
jgi:hypothetical protein